MLDLKKISKEDAILIQSGLKALGFYKGTTRGFPAEKTQSAYEKYLLIHNDKSFGELLAIAAEGQVGAREVGNNGGEAVRMYQAATWYAPGPWPWCAAFVCWCFQQALKHKPLAIKPPTTPGAWAFEKWASDEGAELIKPARISRVRRGDIVVFAFSHIGIAVGDEMADGTVKTVEGNTNDGGDREGDGVYRKTRKKSQIRSIIRI